MKATIEQDGGFTIPPEILERLQLEVGDPVTLEETEYGIIIRKEDDTDPE